MADIPATSESWQINISLTAFFRLAREKISVPSPSLKTWLLSFNRTQPRVVIGLRTGHNRLRRHLHLMGLSCSPLCKNCGAEEETSTRVLCECEALASLRHVYLGSFFIDPEDVNSLSLGAIRSFSKGLDIRIRGKKGPSKVQGTSGTKGLEPSYY